MEKIRILVAIACAFSLLVGATVCVASFFDAVDHDTIFSGIDLIYVGMVFMALYKVIEWWRKKSLTPGE